MAAKVLLQDPLTGFYFRGLGTWTNDPDRAIIFCSEREAREFCIRASMANIQIQNLRQARSLQKLAIRKIRMAPSRLRPSPETSFAHLQAPPETSPPLPSSPPAGPSNFSNSLSKDT